ncbi:phage/plasmid replication protein, II/X family [Moraxella bovis]|uniref:phage/plasmid replication protein, II/X family n=1 Tax=Moraxella bovis TaxID=476 RepID=UPI0009929BCB|nr:phage/plasmid replication protein, II/X family [Moraxella bovis]OOR88190.1 replication protein [Moraxella bovis]UZA17879.1 phage/plasmid replication protein, II/X family [Moraxella bovis]UZA17890.1 phage/plasmid replication protein, II/X family [Moraxella bovis]UZA17901.1 phage/plasmid replication protein, II/X family [Moraxella bovis]
MLDHLRLRIPVLPPYSKEYGDDTWVFTGDMMDLGLILNGRSVSRRDDGSVRIGDLYAPYDEVGTDYSYMAVKFYHEARNCLPNLEIKASPNKLMQGHNVYGFESIRKGARHMLSMVVDSYPELCKYLDFRNVEVMHFDCTYSARLPHQNLVQPMIDFLANVRVGHRKANHVKFDNYITFNSQSNRYVSTKIYGKFEELKSQIDKYQKKADTGCIRSKNLVVAMHDALKFSNALLRFEARIHKTYLSKNGYPTNLYDLIDHQEANPNFLKDMWGVSFNPILNAIKGSDIMLKNYDDDMILDICKKHLTTIGTNGKRYETKAKNAFRLYSHLREFGFVKTKKLYSESSFYDNLNNLISCGFSRAFLQNLHQEKNTKVIPFTRLIEINFNEQLPPDYIEPVSQYDDFNLKVA